ncbi:MAG: SDR family oxidoreductase [Bacteroidetes bacterium]|nr:SDR family oxidoreductase [Bacteroidota bacterium]
MNKTALITGAAGGIGLELARLLAKDNYNLVLVDKSETLLKVIPGLQQLAPTIQVKPVLTDLTRTNVAQELFDELKKEGIQIEILINNAGFGNYGAFAETDWEVESRMLQLHVLTLTHMTKLFLREMLKRGSGKIMNVASVAAFQPSPFMAIYFASKAFVLHFSEAIANEVKGTGVTVTVLCPGTTKTGFQETVNAGMPEFREKSWVYTSAEAVAEYGYKAMMSGKTVAIHRFFNYVSANLSRFLPRNTVTQMVRRIQEKNRAGLK